MDWRLTVVNSVGDVFQRSASFQRGKSIRQIRLTLRKDNSPQVPPKNSIKESTVSSGRLASGLERKRSSRASTVRMMYFSLRLMMLTTSPQSSMEHGCSTGWKGSELDSVKAGAYDKQHTQGSQDRVDAGADSDSDSE
jgi:hypothetical protein